MTRTEDDSWDIATGVGATAVIVAAARAAETTSPNPLIRDVFAEPLIATTELADLRTSLLAGFGETPEGRANYQRLVDYHAVRTHFFDAYFDRVCSAGIAQIVLLAAGLDARAFRRSWPDGTVVYELDLPKVLEYKSATLAGIGARPTATRREVPIDLRDDWPKALQDAGFDSTQSAAWLAEGLLPFLSHSGQETLFSHIDELSVPGALLAAESFADRPMPMVADRQRAQVDSEGHAPAQSALVATDLWYGDEGFDCPQWLASHTWRAEVVDSRDAAERLGRHVPSILDGDEPLYSNFIVAEKL